MTISDSTLSRRKWSGKIPEQVTWGGMTATPKEWADMVGVEFESYRNTAIRLRSWEAACDLKHYRFRNQGN